VQISQWLDRSTLILTPSIDMYGFDRLGRNRQNDLDPVDVAEALGQEFNW